MAKDSFTLVRTVAVHEALVEMKTWKELLSGGLKDASPVVAVETPLEWPDDSATGTFLAKCSDGVCRYIKTVDNLQENPRIVLNEFVVAKVGELIGAPACQVDLVTIPVELGLARPDGTPIHSGVALGSRDVGGQRIDTISHRDLDHNRKRHVGILALCELCGAHDHQWLVVGEDMTYYSHDHGSYFTSALWTQGNLRVTRDDSFCPEYSATGLCPVEVSRLAACLRAITRDAVAPILLDVPLQWDVPLDDLEALGEFIEHRVDVTARMLDTFTP